MKSFTSLWVFILLIPHFVVAVGQADLLNMTADQRKQLRYNLTLSCIFSKDRLHSFSMLALLQSKQLTPAQRDTKINTVRTWMAARRNKL